MAPFPSAPRLPGASAPRRARRRGTGARDRRRSLASSLLAQSPTPGTVHSLVDTLVATATLDSGWSTAQLGGLVTWARRLDLGRDLSMSHPPTRPGTEGAAQVLHLDPAAEPVLARFRPEDTGADR